MHGRTFIIHYLPHPDVIANPLLVLEVNVENIFFSTATQIEHLQPVLDSEPAPTTLKVKQYTTILSQPLKHGFKWNDKQKVVVDWPIYLDSLGHGLSFYFWCWLRGIFIAFLIAQQWNYKPEKNVDYLSAPETLLQGALCSLQTDIWTLGCLVSCVQ